MFGREINIGYVANPSLYELIVGYALILKDDIYLVDDEQES